MSSARRRRWRGGWSVITGRAAEHLLARWQSDHAGAGRVGAVLGAEGLDRHFIAHLEIVLPPAPPNQLNGRPGFELPLFDARVDFGVDVDPGVRIHPLDFGDITFYVDV